MGFVRERGKKKTKEKNQTRKKQSTLPDFVCPVPKGCKIRTFSVTNFHLNFRQFYFEAPFFSSRRGGPGKEKNKEEKNKEEKNKEKNNTEHHPTSFSSII
jgi:hypothetical protein